MRKSWWRDFDRKMFFFSFNVIWDFGSDLRVLGWICIIIIIIIIIICLIFLVNLRKYCILKVGVVAQKFCIHPLTSLQKISRKNGRNTHVLGLQNLRPLS